MRIFEQIKNGLRTKFTGLKAILSGWIKNFLSACFIIS